MGIDPVTQLLLLLVDFGYCHMVVTVKILRDCDDTLPLLLIVVVTEEAHQWLHAALGKSPRQKLMPPVRHAPYTLSQ